MTAAQITLDSSHAVYRPALKIQGNLNWKAVTATLNPSTSYATGGDVITLPNGLNDTGITIARVFLQERSGTYIPLWVYASGKLKMMSALGTEVTATTNLSTVVVDALFLVYGRGG